MPFESDSPLIAESDQRMADSLKNIYVHKRFTPKAIQSYRFQGWIAVNFFTDKPNYRVCSFISHS